MEQWLGNLTIGKALLIGIGIAAGYYYFLYNNGATLRMAIQRERQSIAKNQMQIASINRAIQAAKTYKAVKATLGAEMKSVIKAIPTQLTSLQFMQTISNKAKSAGLQINSVAPGGTFQSPNFGTKKKIFFEPIVVSVQLTGTYNQVMRFMSSLTALNKIVTVEDLTINGQSSTTSSAPVISMSSNLAAYRFLTGNKGASL